MARAIAECGFGLDMSRFREPQHEVSFDRHDQVGSCDPQRSDPESIFVRLLIILFITFDSLFASSR